MKKSILFLTLFILLGSLPTVAQELGDNPIRAKLFYYIDAEGDGTISLPELKAVDPTNSAVPAETRAAAGDLSADTIFGQIDTDKNGFITRAEFVNANIPGLDQTYGYLVTFIDIVPVRFVRYINEADTDMDQKITRQEAIDFETSHGSDDGARLFDSLDIDGNGYLDANEYGGLPAKIQYIVSDVYVLDPQQ